MRIFINNFSVAIVLTINAFSQSDPQALKILDKFSSTALSAPSVTMKFHLVTINEMENSVDTIPGTITMSKDKYVLDLTDNITWFNGVTSWNYLPAEKEVTITKPDRKDESFRNRPSAVFSMYKNGYKNKLIDENSESYLIDLYPENIKSELIRMRLSVGKLTSYLKSAEYKTKDGLTVKLIVDEYNLKLKPDPALFTFSPEKFKGVEIIDMR
jgi:outer membrane lipoprotein carrier protein